MVLHTESTPSRAIETDKLRAPAWKPFIVAATAATACVLIVLHVQGINGPDYWQWPWRRLAAWRLYPAMFTAALPFLLGQLLAARYPAQRHPGIVRWVLSLSMVSSLVMSFVASGMQTPSFGATAIYRTITDEHANGYLADADTVLTLRQQGLIDFPKFFRQFPRIMPLLHIHSRSRPPGIILYFMAMRAAFTNTWRVAVFSALLIGLMASLSIPATYALVYELTGLRDGALAAASYFAICPAFVLFFPDLDPIYPTYTALLSISWLRALTRGRLSYALAFGAMLGVMCFFAFNILVVGAFLAGLTLLSLRSHMLPGQTERPVAFFWAMKCVLAALLAYVAFWVVVRLTIGFDIIETFSESLVQQARFDQMVHRPYPRSIPWDLYDFILGSGWIALPIVVMGWAAWRRQRCTAIVLLCLSQLLLVALLKVLQTETARVWLLMQPLLLVPVGIELAGWSRRQLWVVYLSLLLVTLATAQNMWFIRWTGAQ